MDLLDSRTLEALAEREAAEAGGEEGEAERDGGAAGAADGAGEASGSGGWGVSVDGLWGALSRLNKDSVRKLAGDALATVRQDMKEFVSAVAEDIETVETSLPELAARASELPRQLGGGYGHSLLTGTTELFTQARAAGGRMHASCVRCVRARTLHSPDYTGAPRVWPRDAPRRCAMR